MDVIRLGKRHPSLPQNDLMALISNFNGLNVDSRRSADPKDVIQSLTGKEGNYDEIRETLKEVDVDSTGRLELDDYVEIGAHELVSKLRSGSTRSARATKGKVFMRGANDNTTHSVNEDERTEFTRHINQALGHDSELQDKLPLPTDTFQIFDECKDGLILCKLINDSVPDTIDERVLNKANARKALNAFQMSENNNVVIASAKGIGCSVVNIGSEDISSGREHLILGLIWQIIRKGLLSKIDIKLHPELYRLLYDDEKLEDFLKLPPDQILLRWFNYHLKAAGWSRRVNNFSKDIMDSENYTILLNQLKPDSCSKAPLQTRDLKERAEQVLVNAERIGCRKFVSANSICSGNPKLNLAFVAHLFNTWPGLAPLETPVPIVVDDFDAEGEREARVFTLWLNSMNVDPGVYNLFEDLSDGTILLQAFDKVVPGSVTWRRVNKRPVSQEDDEYSVRSQMSRFKAVENTNYALELARTNNMVIVSTQGSDLVDGNKTLVLGMVWQMMRLSIAKTLSVLGKNGRDITDAELIKWANDTVKKGGKTSSLRSFKDPNVKTGIFLLDVLNGMKPGYVDYNLINHASNDEAYKQNAKLAISIARKIGALIFIVPEDIVDVRAKLIFTFLGSLCVTSLK